MKLTVCEWILGGAISSPLLWSICKKILPFKEKVENSIPPFMGHIEELKDLIPAKYRKWYLHFSRIFCPFIYFAIQIIEKRKSRPIFDSIWIPIIFTAIFFFVSLFIHRSLWKKLKNGILSSGESYYFIPFIIFCAFTVFITVTYGESENHFSYQSIEGIITINNKEEKVTEKVRIVISLEGTENPTYESEKNGKFFIFIKNDQYDRINTIQFSLQKEGKLFISTRSIEDLPINQPWEIILKEALNDNSLRGIFK
jgi:hypothetical protein